MILKTWWECCRYQSWTRTQQKASQDQKVRKILCHAFDHSSFYRQLYQNHHLQRQDLMHVALSEIPTVDKNMLMDNFDLVVSNPKVTKKSIESWIASDAELSKKYLNRYRVVHTSGSSGNTGIFIHDPLNWERSMAATVLRISNNKTSRRISRRRVAFFGAIEGRYCGVTFVRAAPKLLFEVRTFSVFQPIESVVDALNKFKPDRLIGYAMSIAQLAKLALNNKLHIQPRRISTSGEPLRPEDADLIQRAWNITPINLYKASEVLIIGADCTKKNGKQIFEDLNCLEILANDNSLQKEGVEGNVCLTNLSNTTFPIIRYRMDDKATKLPSEPGEKFARLSSLIGRDNPAIPIMNASGACDELHPSLFEEFYVPGLLAFQFFISKDRIDIHYVAKENLEPLIRQTLREILQLKNAQDSMQTQVKRVTQLTPNAQTGKFKLITLLI